MYIYCIGIGGVAVAALAAIYKEMGYNVRGSDVSESEITQIVRKKGIEVLVGHNPGHITKDIDLVVFSEAVPQDNVELKRAQDLGIRCQPAAQAIGDFSRHYFTIAVSGMHGKTTTCCMIAQAMIRAGLDPSFIIGTKDGGRLGKSRYLVIEADDYRAKFLNYYPEILVLTNIDREHLDYYKNLDHIKEVFRQYVKQVKNLIVANKDDKLIREVLREARCNVTYYSRCDLKLKVPGVHNQYNAAAALEVLKVLGVDQKTAKDYLAQYQGTWRRFQEFEVIINGKKVWLIVDYGHHPTEIKATMQAARSRFPKKKIVLIFQPHQYQRTFYLRERFLDVFKEILKTQFCNDLIITDIYDVPGRESEEIKKKIKAHDLVGKLNHPSALYIPYQKINEFIKKNVHDQMVIVMMGAGDIYELSTDLLKNCLDP